MNAEHASNSAPQILSEPVGHATSQLAAKFAVSVAIAHPLLAQLFCGGKPEGRKLFERFLRQVNELQAQQKLEAQVVLYQPS
jgi:hypothetical protein